MPSILFLDTEPEDRSFVAEEFPDATFGDGSLTDEALIALCKDAEVISCFIHTQFTRDIIARLPRLKLLCTRSVGFDHIDTAACEERGITVCNVPDYGSHVIAEHVFALLLSTLRHIPEGDERVSSGEFDYRGLRGVALKNKTIGILGTGKIGRAVARIAFGFGMNILAVDQCRTMELQEFFGVKYVTFDEMIAGSDIITLHVPALPSTNHLLSDAVFAKMKDGVILVNTARGSLIDSQALFRALQSGKVSRALLDVLEHEMNFEENAALTSHPNVVATPHIAFYADDSMRKMFTETFQSIHEWQAGAVPQHKVMPPRLVCDMPPLK